MHLVLSKIKKGDAIMNIVKLNRKIKGISISDLAKELGLPTLLYIMHERHMDFTVEQYYLLCSLLEIEFDDAIF